MGNKVEVYENDILISTEDDRTLADALAEANLRINQYREVKLAAGMWYLGYFWATDGRARTNLTAMVAAVCAGIPLPSGFTWRDNNNNNVPMNATALVTFSAYLVQYVNMVYTYSWTLKANLDACVTVEDVDAINVFDGWPDGNMDGSMPEGGGSYTPTGGDEGLQAPSDPPPSS